MSTIRQKAGTNMAEFERRTGVGNHLQSGARRIAACLPLLVATALLAAVSMPRQASAGATFVKTIGTFTSTTAGQTQSSVTVPAAGVAAGASIILTVGMPSNALVGAMTATDTAGNIYAVDSDVTNPSQVRIVVLSSHKVNPLVSGNTITVTHPSTNRRNLVAAEFAGLAAAPVDQVASNTGTLNSSNPPTSGTTAETTSANQVLIGAFGVAGSSADNFNLTGSGYTQIARVSASNTAPAVQNAAIYQIVDEVGEYSAGFTTSTGTTRQYAGTIVTYAEDALCGNGVVDSGEDCDLGEDNGEATSCCTLNCRFSTSAQTCRGSAGACDVAETCTGSSDTCPADSVRDDTFVCRAAAGECDIAELCDGVSTDCPTNEFVAEDTPCTDDGTSCTIDICNGVNAQCQHPADTGSPCVKFIQTIGTFTSTTALTTSSVTVPAAGVGAGASIILTVGLPSNALVGAVSATDTAGNTYTVDADVTNPSQTRIVVLSAHKVDALASGNTITVTHPSTNRRNLVAAEYSGLAAPSNVDQTSSNTGTMNSSNAPTSGLTATTTQADQLLIGAFGVAGSLADNFNLTTSGYSLAGRVSASNTAPAVQNAQIYRVVNQIGEYSAGFTTSTATTRQYAGAIVTYKADEECGDGELDAGEECDLGFAVNGTNGVCCSRNCQFRAPTVVCRAQNGICDQAENCTGASDTCPVDSMRPDGFVCRAIPAGEAGACDPVAEVCDGISNLCPDNFFLPAGSECAVNNDTNPCTVDECNGTQAACTHVPGNAGAVCREAAASCDAPEVCTGVSAACPGNVYLPAGTVCREATDLCDIEETCSGLGQSCGPDNIRPNGFVCRTAEDLCDVDDTCNGVLKACIDNIAPAGTECRASAGLCDPAEICDGAVKECPADELEPSDTVCRPSAGACDIYESCTGSDPECPADVLRGDTEICECHASTLCTGSDAACPDDSDILDDGTACVGENPNSCMNACFEGACSSSEPVTAQACCGNGIIDIGESCDDGNQVSGDGDTCPSLPGDDCSFAASGTLVRGARSNPARDQRGCQLQLAVTNPGNPLDRFGYPSSDQVCQDQDPACDLDPTVGRCRIAVATCVNNQDPGMPACTPNGVGLVTLTSLRARVGVERTQLAAANTARLRSGLEHLLDPANPQDWYSRSLPVFPAERNFCSSTALIDVLAGSNVAEMRRNAYAFKARSVDINGKPSRTLVRFMCAQAAEE